MLLLTSHITGLENTEGVIKNGQNYWFEIIILQLFDLNLWSKCVYLEIYLNYKIIIVLFFLSKLIQTLVAITTNSFILSVITDGLLLQYKCKLNVGTIQYLEPFKYTVSSSILTKEQRNFYEENGFLVIRQLVSEQNIQKYRYCKQ